MVSAVVAVSIAVYRSQMALAFDAFFKSYIVTWHFLIS